MLRRKARSDAELPVAFGKAEKVESSDACKEEARSSRVATCDADWGTTGADDVESGGIKLNQSGDAGTSSFALGDEAAELLGIPGERERNGRVFTPVPPRMASHENLPPHFFSSPLQ
jgi:hypothetical protein